ncbi:thioredoxin [Heyndrickxia shackletonii]|uniref:Thioredoxin n=1 Tax=Heyndrickxia shackletonii TaxID=157838 RepID=A0A0Q3WQZ2_9BACI|nr:thioredoxin family protein [Heyndrickxia shackletonii]KQL51444.1 thioredoxin [Heyndrickxia shackletonii]NEZ00789.1 thioredoxin family protein [Heyndrickxia shackletonii]
MTSLNEWFEKGMTSKEYIESMKVHKENLLSIYEGFRLPKEDEPFFKALSEKGLRAIVITEDWCGDAMVNTPILLRLAEATNIDVHMVLRDQNLELMDQYLTNGTARSIPIFIFIDKKGVEVAKWGPRAPKVQEMVTEMRSGLPPKEDPSFDEKQKEVYAKLQAAFTQDTSVWETIYSSLKSTLNTVL